MTETRHPDEPLLRKAVSDFLAFRSVTTATGPSKAYFEIAAFPDTYRIVYHAYGFGATPGSLSVTNPTGDSTWTAGRFRTYDEILPVIMDFLRANIDQPFMIWRKEPELYFERGYLKAYMRFATTDNPEHFLEAGRQYSQQEAERAMQDAASMASKPDSAAVRRLASVPGQFTELPAGMDIRAFNAAVRGVDCRQPQNPARPLASGSGTANTPENENASPEPPEGVLDMRGMLRRTQVPDFEPDLDTEALFQAGRPIL